MHPEEVETKHIELDWARVDAVLGACYELPSQEQRVATEQRRTAAIALASAAEVAGSSDTMLRLRLAREACRALDVPETVVALNRALQEPLDTSYNGGGLSGGDAFVTRLSANGSSLIYSTYLGGTGGDSTTALALDAGGAATVAGTTESADFPSTPGAFDTTHNGGLNDAFVARLASTGASLGWSTFLGGTAGDGALDLALDAQGAATVVGTTASSNFPTTAGAYDTTYNGGNSDAFVAKLSPAGANLVYSTFLGGATDESAAALALDAHGAAASVGLPLPNDINLVGGNLNAQFIWFGPTAPPPCPPLGLSASNALAITLQP